MFGGLWRGAISTLSSIPFKTFSSIITDWAKSSPPCTTLWPTASISSSDLIAPYSSFVRDSITSSRALLWSCIGVSIVFFSFPIVSCLILEPSIPILSTKPFAINSSVSISMSWYFREEDPQLITNIFMFPPHVF